MIDKLTIVRPAKCPYWDGQSFFYDFQDTPTEKVPLGWTPTATGVWAVEAHNLLGATIGGGAQTDNVILLWPFGSLEDCWIEVAYICNDSTAGIGPMVRASGSLSGGEASIDGYELDLHLGNLSLQKFSSGSSSIIASDWMTGLSDGVPYRVGLAIRGSKIAGYWNGRLIGTYSDTTYTSGALALKTYDTTTATVWKWVRGGRL